jgi:hypothetical protein
MIELLIRALLTNFSLAALVAAIVLAIIAAWRHSNERARCFANRLLGWLLLVAIGLPGIYTFVMHVFFPAVSAANIGWAMSPFQYEVGIADLTVGVLGVAAFWGNFSFRLAAVVAATLWLGGDAVGHVHQMIAAHNFAPGNAGSWFWTDVLVPLLLVVCTAIVWKDARNAPLDTVLR